MSTGKNKGWWILNLAQARFIEGYFNLDKARKKDPEVLFLMFTVSFRQEGYF